MTPAPEARWWAVRSARNLKPATYRCPFCGRLLHAMTDHVLIAPEGDSSRRRHAHTACAARAHAAGRLPTLDDWRAAQDGGPARTRRLRLPWRR